MTQMAQNANVFTVVASVRKIRKLHTCGKQSISGLLTKMSRFTADYHVFSIIMQLSSTKNNYTKAQDLRSLNHDVNRASSEKCTCN